MAPVQSPEITALARAIAEARDLLRKHGDKWTSSRLDGLYHALGRGDFRAVQTAVSEATGGMGSLRDRYLTPANGDVIRPEEVEYVNGRLHALVEQIEGQARIAAAALGIVLFR